MKSELKYTIIPTHITEIKVGDTIKCRDGVIRTVGQNNIKQDKFMGRSVFGDTYNLGYIPVQLLKIQHAR